MHEWRRQVQEIVDNIDACIKNGDDHRLTLREIARSSGYSEFHVTRSFSRLTGLPLREYLRKRRLAFALIDLRDSKRSVLDIAVSYGYSSHEAFSRAFKSLYGVSPAEYRTSPVPVVLRTKINTFDRYFLGLGEIGMIKSNEDVKIYFATVPAFKFLHIKNYATDGYWDFWAYQDSVDGQDCDTICGLLDSVRGKLDGEDGVIGKYSGQIMAWIYEDGRKARAYGVRLPADYSGIVPPNMLIIDVPEGDYIVFEHGSFDYEQEKETVYQKMRAAIDGFSYDDTGYAPDHSPGRLWYGVFDPDRCEKEVMPVRRV